MEGISLSVEDKLTIARKLDELGVHYIEGGFPGSNPKDAEFFVRARDVKLKHARLVAFGSTRRAGGDADTDPTSQRPRSTPRHPSSRSSARRSDAAGPRCPRDDRAEENLAMIADSVRFLTSNGATVFFDAEHFFDGFVADPEYAHPVLRAAAGAGADASSSATRTAA